MERIALADRLHVDQGGASIALQWRQFRYLPHGARSSQSDPPWLAGGRRRPLQAAVLQGLFQQFPSYFVQDCLVPSTIANFQNLLIF